MRRIGSRGVLAVVVGTAAAVTAACGSSDSGSQKAASASGPVTLTWWHNGTSDPLKGVWQGVANSYHASHPKVTIKVQPIQNEQFTTKVPLALQSSNPPEVYQQWGGGQEATQVQSGKLMDLTPLTQSWIKQIGPAAAGWQVNGRQYGVPVIPRIVRTRNVGEAIVDEARRRRAEIIVLGAEQRKRGGERMFGKVIDYVLRNADCRVMVGTQPTG